MTAVLRLERNAITDPELKHGLMGMHLIHESEALHNAVIQIYKFRFSQMIYVDAIHIPSEPRNSNHIPRVKQTTSAHSKILRFFGEKNTIPAEQNVRSRGDALREQEFEKSFLRAHEDFVCRRDTSPLTTASGTPAIPATAQATHAEAPSPRRAQPGHSKVNLPGSIR